MHLATVLSDILRSLHRALTGGPSPICDRCGSGSLLRTVIDQLVHNEPDRKLHQFYCAVCETIIEKLR